MPLHFRALWLASVIFLAACNNVRQFDVGNIRATSLYWHKSQYAAFRIGTPLSLYDGRPEILLKLSDGTVINTGMVDSNTLEKKCPGRSEISGEIYADIGTPSRAFGVRWPAGSVRLQDGTREFVIKDKKIISIAFWWNEYEKLDPPEAGNARTGKLYRLPLSESIVQDLFGTTGTFSEYFWE